MKRFIIFILILIASHSISAQEYLSAEESDPKQMKWM